MNEKPYNVIFYVVDQLRWDALGAYGNKVVKTPHLDRFAGQSIRFNHMYSQYPLCGPSRACFATGQYPQAHRARYNGIPVPMENPRLSRTLRQNGYRTALVGIADLEPREGAYHGYEQYRFKSEYGPWARSRGVSHPNAWQKNDNDAYKKAGPHIYGTLDDPAELHFSNWMAETCAEVIEQWKDEPFFLFAGERIPHPPYLVPAPYDRMYRPEQIELPPSVGGDEADRQALKEAMCHYYGLVSLMDASFGKVLRKVEEAGLMERTIILFVSDHGNLLGAHAEHGKMSLYDDDVRLPFLMHIPGDPGGGRVVDGLLEQIDIFPTLLDILNIPCPRGVQGRSFVPTLEGRADGKEAVYAFQGHEYGGKFKRQMIRTRDWKLIFTQQSKHMLFDMKNDPDELHNVYGRSEFHGIEGELKDRLLMWHLTDAVDATVPSMFFDEDGKDWVRQFMDPLRDGRV